MSKDTMSRKWQVTINNPLDKGFTHDYIMERISEMKNVVYWCMGDEIGENETYHTHIYICGKNGIRFSTIQTRFTGGHFEMAKGTSQQNMEYVSKSGKWVNDKKQETSVPDTFVEFGELPVERQGKRTDLDDLYAMIKDGFSDFDILEQDASYMLHMDKLERARQTIVQERYKNEWRNLEVTYIFGDTESGKTRGVMEEYGYSNVFRVTDYAHPFDGYKGQDVVVFEEFRSSFRVSEMLNYLDGYPLELPCRYANKFACYTKVYLISNIPLSQQYSQLQIESYESYRAFLRRIHKVRHHVSGVVEVSKMQILPNGFNIIPFDDTPFN